MLLFVGLTAMSAVALFTGSPVWGTIGILLFGGGGILYFVLTRNSGATTRRRPARTTYGHLPGMRRFTDEPAGLVFPGSRLSTVATLLGSLVFVVAGLAMVAMAFAPSASHGPAGPVLLFLVGLAGITVFSVFGVLALLALARGGNGIALVADGVYFRAPAGRAWVGWDDLKSVRLGDGIQFLVHSPEQITLTGLNRWLHRVNRDRFGMDVGYPTMLLKGDPGDALERITYFHSAPEARVSLRDPGTANRSIP
ncbi:hypothetical protein J4H86_08870 [Spiractinospora alimapuensis]|uniref:hypothetical protein n=1 Tax=Spiractinospora alimapuensis TaxID=2820884 RepID=UPI001F3410B0|nr:hypothetical protein [Spiractinospora alimapuensis]QVQ53807.1 hypothetical protein J4H86_08870 [Spiractinospora alimapuensis]